MSLPPLPETRWLAHGTIDGKPTELRGWHEEDLDDWFYQVHRMLAEAQQQVDAYRLRCEALHSSSEPPHTSGGLLISWMPFDYAAPPEDGPMWVAVSAPETDCDVDNYGRTVGWETGGVELSVALVMFYSEPSGEMIFEPLNRWDLGHVPERGWVTHYAPVTPPEYPDTDADNARVNAPGEALHSAPREPLTKEQLRDVLRQVAESIDSHHIVATHWTQVARAVERAIASQPVAQREPLTDEQIDALPWGPHEGKIMTFSEGLRDFARAIERAHGILEHQ